MSHCYVITTGSLYSLFSGLSWWYLIETSLAVALWKVVELLRSPLAKPFASLHCALLLQSAEIMFINKVDLCSGWPRIWSLGWGWSYPHYLPMDAVDGRVIPAAVHTISAFPAVPHSVVSFICGSCHRKLVQFLRLSQRYNREFWCLERWRCVARDKISDVSKQSVALTTDAPPLSKWSSAILG